MPRRRRLFCAGLAAIGQGEYPHDIVFVLFITDHNSQFQERSSGTIHCFTES